MGKLDDRIFGIIRFFPGQGADVVQDFKALCVGDANGSNIPSSGAKSSSKIKLDYTDFIVANAGEEIEIPLISTRELDVGAVSMILKYHSINFSVG